MTNDMTAIGLELIVEDLDRSIELLTTVMGCTLISRNPSPLIDGEVAAIDAGNIVISLVKPVPFGPGASLSERQPRLAQIVFGTSTDGVRSFDHRAVENGLSVVHIDDGRVGIVPEAVRGAFGLNVALVAVPIEQESDA